MNSQNAAKADRPGHGLAIASIIMLFLFFPIGVILAIIALIKAPGGDEGRGTRNLAIATLALSALAIPIMGILAAIAIPNFIRYQLKSKQSEAKVMLRSISTGQEAFFARYNRYANIDWHGQPSDKATVWPLKECEASCESDPSTCRQLSCIGVEPGPTRYVYACSTSSDGQNVSCAAAADLDGDGEFGVMVWGTGTNSLVVPPPHYRDAGKCDWERLAPGEVSECERNQF